MIGLYATRILHATGKLLGARLLLEQALIAEKQMQELGADHYDYGFYQGKVMTAKFFARNILPEVSFVLTVIKDGDTSALDIEQSAFFA
jgi:hypothetical protein